MTSSPQRYQFEHQTSSSSVGQRRKAGSADYVIEDYSDHMCLVDDQVQQQEQQGLETPANGDKYHKPHNNSSWSSRLSFNSPVSVPSLPGFGWGTTKKRISNKGDKQS